MNIYIMFMGLGVILILSTFKIKLNNRKKLRVAVKKQETVFKKLWENNILTRLMAPKPGTTSYEASIRALCKAGIKSSVESIVSLKIGVLITVFCLSVTFYLYYLDYSKQQLLKPKPETETTLFIIGGSNEKVKSTQNITYNFIFRELLKRIPEPQSYMNNGNIETVWQAIIQIEEEYKIQDADKALVRDIMETLIRLSNIKPSMAVIILLFCISLISTKLVDIYIKIRTSIRTGLLESEFEKVELIILVLLKEKNTNLASLLKKMAEYTTILRPYVERCLNLYTVNPNTAIDGLIQEVDNIEFTKFMTILKQNLKTNKETNIQLIDINKRLRVAMTETLNKQKNKHKRVVMTMAQLPLLILNGLILIIPMLLFVNNYIQ